MPKNYWMVALSPGNFRITRDLGFTVQGLKGHHHRKLRRVEPGDRILYYVGRDRIFGATATVKSQHFEDRTPTWEKDGVSDWIFRVRIQPNIVLDESEYIDARQLAPRLEYVRKWAPESWYIAFAQGYLHLLPKADFLMIEEEMRKIKAAKSSSGRPPARAPYPAKRRRLRSTLR